MARTKRIQVPDSSDVEALSPVKPVKKQSKKAGLSQASVSNGAAIKSGVPPASSFFAPKPKLKQTATKESPICLDSPKKPSTSAEYDAIRREERKRKAAQMQGYEPSWPTSESMHVKGDQTSRAAFNPVDSSASDALGFVVRAPRKRPRVDSSYIEKSGVIHRLVSTSPEPEASTSTLPATDNETVESLPSDHRLTQRISANKSSSMEGQNREMWTVKYAPRSADEILGTTSRESARVLRSWVKELALRKSDQGELPCYPIAQYVMLRFWQIPQ